jgi:hypothetical protein
MNDMSDRNHNREALEQLWRNRLKDAKLRLDFARSYLKEVRRDFHDREFPVPSPDGNFAYRKALRAENAALAEYRRILAVVADLFTTGEAPAQQDSPGGNDVG